MKTFLSKKTCGAMVFGIFATMASADASACFISCAFHHVFHSVWSSVDKGAKFASSTARQAASITDSEWTNVRANIKNTATSTYATAASGAQSAYNQSVRAAMTFLDDLLAALIRQAARSAVAANGPMLSALHKGMDNLSQASREAEKRILGALVSNNITNNPQLQADLKILGAEIKTILNSAQFKYVENSSWGLSINGDVGDGITGQQYSLAIAVNLTPDSNNVIQCAILYSTGHAVGVSEGATASVSIFWQPGLVKDSAGPSVGVGMSVATLETGGLGVGASWGIPTGLSLASMRSAITQIPSFSMSADIPGSVITEVEFSGDVNVGQTVILAGFGIPL